ncbi:hypothetical protein ACIRPU_37170 [Streptomyces sp. NPDC102259]
MPRGRDLTEPAHRPEPALAPPRARTRALAAEYPLSPHLSHDGDVR